MWYPELLTIQNLASHELSSYQFQAGRVVVIQGENHDKHSGQESNGSGKSGLLEGLAVALAGTSFRKVRAVELVRNGQDWLRVVFAARNTKTAQTMEIERVIFSSSKASKVAVKLNGEPVSRLTSVDEANTFILEQLGVSKEDLLNYFLISKEKFCSFFDTADSKKKELINRFSGADRLDQVLPDLEESLAKAERAVSVTQQTEIQARTRVGVYSDELKEMQAFDRLKEREEKVAALVEQANTLEGEYGTAKDLYQQAVEVEGLINKELEALGKDTSTAKQAELTTQAQAVATAISKLQADVSAVEGPGSKWQTERADLLLKKGTLQTELETAKATRREIEDFEADLQKTIRGSVACPKCQHHFSLAEPGSDIAACRHELQELTESMLPDAKSAVVKLELAISRVDADLEVARENMEKRRFFAEEEVRSYRKQHEAPLQRRGQQIHEESQQFFTKRSEISERLSLAQYAVRSAETRKDRLKSALADVNTTLETLQNQELEDLTAPILAKLDKAQQELTKAEAAHEQAKVARDKTAAWPVRIKQFKSYLANQLLDTLSGYTNLYLEKIGSDLQIELEGYRLLADQKTIKEALTAKLLRGGEDAGSFHKYSGGEKGRVDMCQILAVQHLINLNSPTGGLNLLVTDEILESVDSRGIHEIARKLDNLDKNILLVTHAGADVPFPNRILIEKRNGVSTLAA
jgi:exonuclease SbcC